MKVAPDDEQLADQRQPKARAAAGPGHEGTAMFAALAGAAGNQPMVRLLANRDSATGAVAPAQTAGGNPTQSRVLDDISVEWEDFWAHIRTRTHIALQAWMGDSSRKLNEFVDIMGDAGPADWGQALVSSYLGTLGTAGDVANAMMTTLSWVVAKIEAPCTLFQFRTAIETNMDKVSERLRTNDPSLPIFAAIHALETRPDSDTKAARTKAKADVGQALNRLAMPTDLRKILVQRWIAHSKEVTGKEVGIAFRRNYRLDRGNKFEEIDSDVTKNLTFIGHLERGRQLVKALKVAYDPDMPLSQLGLPMTVGFHVDIVYLDLPAPYHVIWSYEPAGANAGAWRSVTPQKPGNEYVKDVFFEWLQRGRKPTVAELGDVAF